MHLGEGNALSNKYRITYIPLLILSQIMCITRQTQQKTGWQLKKRRNNSTDEVKWLTNQDLHIVLVMFKQGYQFSTQQCANFHVLLKSSEMGESGGGLRKYQNIKCIVRKTKLKESSVLRDLHKKFEQTPLTISPWSLVQTSLFTHNETCQNALTQVNSNDKDDRSAYS